MMFFTPHLLERFGSDDDIIASEAQRELEARSGEYLQHLREVRDKLPQRLRELLEKFYLHDSQVISHSPLGHSAPHTPVHTGLSELTQAEKRSAPEDRLGSFSIVLQLDTPPREILVLQYRFVLVEEPELHQCLRNEECPELEWLYDEVESIPTGRENEFRHSILFTQGLELRLRFKDFDFATLKPIGVATALAEASLLGPDHTPDHPERHVT